MKAYQKRVKDELKELEEKIELLQSFLQGERKDELEDNSIGLLQTQLYYMNRYAEVLRQRIARF